VQHDATSFIARGMTLHNVSATTLVLLLLWLGLGEIESAQMQATPLPLDYSAAGHLGYAGASTTFLRPVGAQLAALASGGAALPHVGT